MATSYEVNAYGANVKVRNPWVMLLLIIVTLGIYGIVWWYKANRELRDFGAVYKNPKLSETNPTLSVLAITLGFLIIVPPFVSAWNTVARTREAQRIAETELNNGWLSGILFVILSIFGLGPYTQYGLNQVWERYEGVEAPPAEGDAEEPAATPETT